MFNFTIDILRPVTTTIDDRMIKSTPTVRGTLRRVSEAGPAVTGRFRSINHRRR